MRHDTLQAGGSPVGITQAELIRLSGPARVIALDVLRINSLQTGAYVSHFRGRGMEFDESRPYQAGDDPRNIDWRVTARSTTAYTKLFREERERPVLIMVDLRRSMHFATRGCYKSVSASRAAALLSWAAHHRGDRLGGLVFGDTTHREIKPRLGRQAALRYVHELVGHPDWGDRRAPGDPGNGERMLTEAMAALRRVARPGSQVVILSDFIDFSRASQAYLAGIARHSEVLAVFFSDPLERKLPPPGRYRVVADGGEMGGEMTIDTVARAARTEYREAFEKRQTLLENFCQRYGVHLMPMSTDEDPVRCLQQALGKRAR